MPARILDGKQTAREIRGELAARVAVVRDRLGRPPGLVAVLVGDDPASALYVKNKEKAATGAGFSGEVLRLPGTTSEAELLGVVDRLNEEERVDGILVQLPLPKQIDSDRVIDRIRPEKDVDGFHPENVGLLAIGRPRFASCTPLGVVELLRRHGVETRGKRAVVLGRSNIVGKPMALLLLRKGAVGDATVTVCHSASEGLPEIVGEADLLVAAVGRPEFVKGSWIKPGAVVVDVGIHRRPDGSLCGDVAFDEAAEVASWISPVPGGVGPMTIAMLLANTVASAERRGGWTAEG
ncbi:bifunctional methylenetetrahydrofolate dehydrogenase/methenyltetrahydrofolate cyclohydrolase FolD [Tautonia sociabilis]|uniref:Bifunctional protein FolD n=1 Tax=Tautonia sociabilis TaxID=2080755 RepID=A0A432MM27_9BACT|nr:bifunctional methylenetetrahydrofolate dehydrogenase/methenyltetrahydrofolate cyclohydrolase FolD [Tautonia sociabilis]RUL88330.1 bifunctional methylenetetrahydrofolate dehydrogenase/methenyltetrahydrofolate cyclohydrolase FolD [Tautonia sociabilis]